MKVCIAGWNTLHRGPRAQVKIARPYLQPITLCAAATSGSQKQLRLLIVGYLYGQVVVVSATMPNEILEMTKKFMTDPVRVLVKRDELTLEVMCFLDGICQGPLFTPLCECKGFET